MPRPTRTTRTLDEATIEQIEKSLQLAHDLQPIDEHVETFTSSVELIREKLDDDSIVNTARYVTTTIQIDDQRQLTRLDVEHELVAHVFPDGFLAMHLDGQRQSWSRLDARAACAPLTNFDEGSIANTIHRRFIYPIDKQVPPALLVEWLIAPHEQGTDTEAQYQIYYRDYYIKLHPDIIDATRAEADIKAVARRLFGSSRKDLIKVLLATEAPFINLAYSLFDDSMPVDVVVRFLSACTKDVAEPLLINVDLLREFSTKSRQKMLNNFSPSRDAISMQDLTVLIECEKNLVAPNKEVKHFAEAESHIVALSNTKRRENLWAQAEAKREVEARRLAWLQTPQGRAWQAEQDEIERRRVEELKRIAREKTEKLRETHAHRVEVHETLTGKLDGHVHEEDGERLTIKVAKDTDTLVSWSDNLGTNCIGRGGYHQYIEDKKALLLGIYINAARTKDILYTAHIKIPDDESTSATLVQFRGFNNRMPEDDEWFDELLAELDITITNK